MPVRPATEDDLVDIVRIYNQAIERSTATFDLTPITVEQRRPWLRRFDDQHPLLVHHGPEGSIQGFAYYLPYRDRPGYARTKELSVYVDFAAHRRGIGRALLIALLDHATTRKVRTMVAVLGGDNPGSEALHRNLGFVASGRLPEVGRKFDRWLDISFWSKRLEP